MDMNCQETRDQIKVCKAQARELNIELSTHLESCELCGHWYADLELDSALNAFHVPAPRDDFVDRVIDAASQNIGHQTRMRAFAMAAAVAVIGVAIGLFLGRGQAPDVVFEVAMVPYEERLVEVVIDTATAHEQATLTIELASSLEIVGFPEQRTIQWQTDLAAGKNLLKLPLRLSRDTDTYFTVLMNYGATEQTMRVDVLTKPQLDQGIGA